MAETVPYVQAYGNITKALERIRQAQTPPRFTQDFLETKLNLSGGSARPVIPFLKRTGFLAPDGTPTDLYKRFRGTEAQSGAAVAEALRIGYAPLFQVNDYVHDAKDSDVKKMIVQVTGAEDNSSQVKSASGRSRRSALSPTSTLSPKTKLKVRMRCYPGMSGFRPRRERLGASNSATRST
jgi:hypothetical protein